MQTARGSQGAACCRRNADATEGQVELLAPGTSSRAHAEWLALEGCRGRRRRLTHFARKISTNCCLLIFPLLSLSLSDMSFLTSSFRGSKPRDRRATSKSPASMCPAQRTRVSASGLTRPRPGCARRAHTARSPSGQAAYRSGLCRECQTPPLFPFSAHTQVPGAGQQHNNAGAGARTGPIHGVRAGRADLLLRQRVSRRDLRLLFLALLSYARHCKRFASTRTRWVRVEPTDQCGRELEG